MPIAKLGMLFMKKFAKCSAATMIRASGLLATKLFTHAAIRRIERLAQAPPSPSDARPVMPGAWLQTTRKHQTHTPATPFRPFESSSRRFPAAPDRESPHRYAWPGCSPAMASPRKAA